MRLPSGVVDPIYMCEMALEFKMTISEMCYGRGTPMSAHELTVIWPEYWAYKRREDQRQADRARKR